jgi:hypothetical protein
MGAGYRRLARGSHTFEVRASDSAGRDRSPAKRRFTISAPGDAVSGRACVRSRSGSGQGAAWARTPSR